MLLTANLPLAPVLVGRRFPRSEWPAHVTVLGNVRTHAPLDAVIGAVRAAAAAQAPFDARIGAAAMFGAERDVPVRLIEGDETHRLHQAMLAALDGFHLDREIPGAFEDGYRPHLTDVPGAPVEGTIRLDRVLLARLDGDLATPVAEFPLGETAGTHVAAADAADTWAMVRAAGVRAWIVGGWGVDALAGRQTRDHHDLDLLVDVDDLPALLHLVDVRLLWSENRFVGDLPTAFVADLGGIEVDVHAVRTHGRRVVAVSEHTVDLPDGSLEGRGVIAGVPVDCATAAAQRVMHSGYEVPEHQRGDIALLRTL